MGKKKWMSTKPVTCEICGNPLKDVFIDGKIKLGPWAIMCERCHAILGEGLGPGKGQKYDLNRLEKIEG